MGKIVNAHVHLVTVPWRWSSSKPDITYLPEDLLREMDRDGVDMSIIVPFVFNYDNEWHCKCAREHPDRLIAYPMVNPWRHKNIKDDLKQYVEWGARGIKMRAPSEGYSINSFDVLADFYEMCQKLGLIVMVHTGDNVCCTPLQCEEVLRYYPKLIMSLAHSGFRSAGDEAIRVAQRNKNIILDQTAGTSQQLRDALAAIEPEQIIWGSDSPEMDERVEMEKIRVVVEDPRVRDKIMGENILNILNIK